MDPRELHPQVTYFQQRSSSPGSSGPGGGGPGGGFAWLRCGGGHGLTVRDWPASPARPPLAAAGTGWARARRRRRSGTSPDGRNHKNARISTPSSMNWIASATPAYPNDGRYRSDSSNTPSTTAAPSIAPKLLPTPPTMIATKYRKVSPVLQEPGDQAPMNWTRIAPLRAASAPPSTYTFMLSAL